VPFTTTTTVFRFASQFFGGIPFFGGNSPVAGGGGGGEGGGGSSTPTGIVFIVSNDRYQVVTCSYGGSLTTAPEFRYWFAAPPQWGEELSGDDLFPMYYADDEDGEVPTGSLELPYRLLKSPQEAAIRGVMVEFIPRPSSLTGSVPSIDQTLGFSAQVEGQGVPSYTRTATGGTTGIAVSDVESFSESIVAQANEPWPNIRTVFLPCRLTSKVRAARVIISAIQLVEIVSVTLIGDTTSPGRSR
jgi:hypothetical protein